MTFIIYRTSTDEIYRYPYYLDTEWKKPCKDAFEDVAIVEGEAVIVWSIYIHSLEELKKIKDETGKDLIVRFEDPIFDPIEGVTPNSIAIYDDYIE